MNDPIVVFVPAWLDACALYRLFLPHLHIKNSRFVFHQFRTPVHEMAEADVVVVQRQGSPGNMKAMKEMREMGMKILYDLDDDLWSIQGSSPAKKIFAPILEWFEACMEFCDGVTVSTEGLRTAVRTSVKKKKPIFVIPNGVDFDYMRPAPLPRSPDRVTVGWGGSNTHAGDVGYAWQVLPDLLETVPQLHLEFAGMAPPKRIAGHPRVRVREFVPVGEYASRFPSWGWDIVLAPLDDNRFNRSKSNIKMLEAAAVGAVCLVSDVEPYRNFCALNDNLKWLLCRTPNDWKNKIQILVTSQQARLNFIQWTRQVAEDHFEQSKLASKWMNVFQEVLL